MPRDVKKILEKPEDELARVDMAIDFSFGLKVRGNLLRRCPVIRDVPPIKIGTFLVFCISFYKLAAYLLANL